ncbi:MAG: ribonuclease P protein component [Planctomycetes bacterium]|nr:ribonuclease P protein component [Planctomycetota bacterium]
MSDRPLSFAKHLHLRTPAQFAAVYANKLIRHAGPLRIHAMANGLPHPRLGLSVSARVGNAVRRNHIKRLLRESFRLLQHDLPAGYDLVVVVSRHDPATLAAYQTWLSDAARKIDAAWLKRQAK